MGELRKMIHASFNYERAEVNRGYTDRLLEINLDRTITLTYA
jgi:hypothetical protein